MTRPRTAAGWISGSNGDDYKRHLRQLAVHDEALLEDVAVEGGAYAMSAIDERTAALVRVAATIAVDASPASFQHAMVLALGAGATSDEIVASLEAVTPVTGAARVVQCAPKVALALGYDVDAALERTTRKPRPAGRTGRPGAARGPATSKRARRLPHDGRARRLRVDTDDWRPSCR